MKNLLILVIGNFYNGLSYFSKSYAAQKAFLLFIKPRKGKPSPKQIDFLDTAFKEELLFEKYPIMTYRWLGKKQTILLAHGWESNSARWKKIITHFKQKGFNVIALDAPAHGQSGGKTFNAVLYSEFINVVASYFQPDIIIGHSVGGMASAFSLHTYKIESVKKIILLGAPSEFKDVFKRYTDMLGYNKRITNQLDTIILDRFGAKPETFSTANYLEKITSEGLIIHDEDDQIIPYNDALLLKNSFKNSILITTKGLGHSLNDDSITQHIYEFIEN